MKRSMRSLGAFALSLILTLGLGTAAFAAQEPSQDTAEYAGYLLRLDTTAAVSLTAGENAHLSGFYSAAAEEMEELIPLAEELGIYKAGTLEDIRNLVYTGVAVEVEKDYKAELFDVTESDYLISSTPDDTMFNKPLGIEMQYSLKDGAGISVQSAWEAGLSGEGVTVAVIDTGINYDHEDMTDNIARGRAFYFREESDGDYEIEVNGEKKRCNYYGQSSQEAVTDDIGHGSMVSGIIAAKTNNGFGIAGIAPNVTIIPIKAFFAEDDVRLGGYVSNLISGIQFAVKNGADIINMSWGVSSHVSTLSQTITAASNAGCILVAAAGNGGSAALEYPAAYSNVISVGATTQSGKLASYSQRNSEVDICAPGSRIYSLTSTSTEAIDFGSGTSFAAPTVAAVIALLKESDPTLTQGDFLTLARKSCDAVTAIENSGISPEDFVGAGKVNMTKLLENMGHSGIIRAQSGTGGVTVQGSLYPKSEEDPDGEAAILLCGYNARGHLLQSAMTVAEKGDFGGYRFAATMDDGDITTLRAFFLRTDNLQAITEGKECSVMTE